MLRRGRFLSATAAAALAGCTSVTTAPSAGGTARVNRFTTPGVLRYSDGEDIGGLNLHIVPQVSVGWLTQFTGAYLIRFDDHSRPYPELLTRVPSLQNGDISRNGLTITYRLRRGAVWSDGAPFTADDVVFSFAAVNNPLNNEYSRAGFEKIADVGKKGDDTAIVRLKEPYGSFFITYFSTQNIPLLPKHLLGNLPNINDAPYNALPVGIGPFKYSVWRRNDAVEMIADPAYFRGRPKLDKIVYKTVTDWNTIETLLRTGELDLAVLAPSNVYDRLAAIPGFRGIGQPSALRAQIEFNCSKAPLDDPVVRHALRLAIDRRAIVAKVEHGHGYLTESLTGPLSPDDANLPLEPYDPKRAAALLDSRGWLAGPSGVRSKDGVPLTIEIANITGRPERDAWMILISSWWSAIGVRTSLKHYPPSVLFGAYSANGILTRGTYEAVVDEEGYSFNGDLSQILACNQFPPTGFNTVRYCNPAVDRAMARLNASYDPAEVKRDAGDVQRALASDGPIVTLYFPQDNFVCNQDIGGLGTFVNFDSARLWSI